MHARRIMTAFLCPFVLSLTLCAESKDEPSRLVLDDFESEPQGWTFIAGWEFPGAKGSLTLDTDTAHGGKRSYKLQADFTGGGAYVGTWRDLTSLEGRDFREIRLWVKTADVPRIGVRIVDSTDQCHQKDGGIRLPATNEWQEVILKVSDLVGGEHWGGANDGKWHGPAKGFGVNIGKDAFPAGKALQGALYLDDIDVVLGAVVEGHPTLHSGVVNPPSCRPGFGTKVTYRWDAEPMGRDFTAFVHFLGPDGKLAFQNDHEPTVATSIWSGRVEYTNNILVPIDAPDGDYRIMLGLYDKRAAERGWDRQALRTGEGVTADKGRGADSENCYQIGVLKVDSQAPLPKLPAPTLDLDGYTMTFHDEFGDLSVSATGPGTRWCTNTKENFGDARFMERKNGFPFTVENGLLRIEAAKRNGVWCGGILASVDPKGQGFAQEFGYFEMRAKFPPSHGMWPAFWLLGQPSLTDKQRPNIEIDVVEHYGVLPNAVHSTMHIWYPGGRHTAKGDFFVAPGLTQQFHTYGVMVDEDHVTWYFDGIETQQQKTPEEAKVPLYLLVNLAMGGGWPIDKAVSPSYMYVDYVRAHAVKSFGP
jgi:hypothetical protein